MNVHYSTPFRSDRRRARWSAPLISESAAKMLAARIVTGGGRARVVRIVGGPYGMPLWSVSARLRVEG